MAKNFATKTFDTIAEAIAQAGVPGTASKVTVLGWSTPGDGGGSDLYWDNTSTETPNNGTIFAVPGVSTGRFKRNVPPTGIPAAFFNIKGDGTDQASKINTMLSVLPSGSVITLEANTSYVVASMLSITKPVTIIGNQSTLNFNFTSTSAINIQSSNVKLDLLNLTGSSGTTYISTSHGILITGSTTSSYFDNISITRCTIKNFSSTAIRFRYVRNFSISQCNISNIPYAGMLLLSCEDGHISDNNIKNIHGTAAPSGGNAYGIALTKDNLAIGDSVCKRITVIGNNVNYVPTWEGLDTHGAENCTFIGNTVVDCLRGISIVDADGPEPVSPKNVTATGNIVDSLGLPDDANRYSIYFTGSDSPVIYATGSITGNSLRGGGIYLRTTKSLVVSSNNIYRPLNGGIYMLRNNTWANITGNIIEDVFAEGSINTAAILMTSSDSNSAYISGNSLVRGDKTVSSGTINAYGFRSNSITNNRAVFGKNDFSRAATAQYVNHLDPATFTDLVATPEGAIISPPGSTAEYPATGTVYTKVTGTSNTGWKANLAGSTLQGITTNGNKTLDALEIDYDAATNGLKHISNPKGAFYNSNTAVTGVIKITMPFGFNNTMMIPRIRVFSYSGTTLGYHSTVQLSGWNVASAISWRGYSASVIGNNAFGSLVRLANDGTKACILLGDVTTVWNNPKVYVEDIMTSNAGNNAAWDTGWTTSLETDISSYTLLTTPITLTVTETPIPVSQKAVASGIASLDANTMLLPSQNGKFNIQSKTASYTITGTDWGIIMNNIAAAIITLPSAASAINRTYWIKKGLNNAFTVTITAGEQGTNIVLSNQNDSVLIQSDGTNYYVVARKLAASSTPTLTDVTTAGNTTTNIVNVGSLGVANTSVLGGRVIHKVSLITVAGAVSASDHTVMVSNTADIVLTLPTATTTDGIEYYFKKISNNANTITLTPFGSELIEGAGTKVISTYLDHIRITSYSNNWYIV